MVGEEYENMQPLEEVIFELADETFCTGVICPDCFCFILYEGICHRCPCNIDYINEAELDIHRLVMELLVVVHIREQ